MSLRRAALVVAVMTIIISFARLAFISIAVNWNIDTSQKSNDNQPFNATPVIRNFTSELMSTYANTDVLNVYIVMGIEIMLHFMNVVFSLILVHGVRKERPCLIKANLIFSGVFIPLSLAVIGTSLIVGIKMTFEVIVYEVILHFLYIYFILVIYFVYVDMRDGMNAINGDSTNNKIN